MPEVDLTWPPERIRDFCESSDHWVLVLGKELTGRDLEELYRRQLTIANPYRGLIAEIAADERTPVWILDDIKSRYWRDSDVVSSLATNPSTRIELLREMLTHYDPDVREHARASMLRLGVAASDEDMFLDGVERFTFKPVCEKCGASAKLDERDAPVAWLTCTACGHRWFLTPDDLMRLLRKRSE